MVNLSDTTFAIIFKPDSKERSENIQLVIHFILSNFKTHLNVLEASDKPTLKSFCDNFRQRIEYNHVIDHNSDLNMTKHRNMQIKSCVTKHIALWDTDVIIEPASVVRAVESLRTGKFQIAFPYNGKLMEVNKILKAVYSKTKSLPLLIDILKSSPSMYGNVSVGAAVIFNTSYYKKMGMDNLAFYKWGHDDIERKKRVEILGAKIFRSNESAYHLYHPRFNYSAPEKVEIDKYKSREELIRICSMTKDELENEVATWK